MINHVTCFPGDEAYEDFDLLPSLIYGTSVAVKKQHIPVAHLLRCVIVYGNGEPAARVALYDNYGIMHNDLPVLIAGAFESINDLPVARYLFETCNHLALLHNKNYIIGPMNGSTWEDYRLNMGTAQQPFFSETIYP